MLNPSATNAGKIPFKASISLINSEYNLIIGFVLVYIMYANQELNRSKELN